VSATSQRQDGRLLAPLHTGVLVGGPRTQQVQRSLRVEWAGEQKPRAEVAVLAPQNFELGGLPDPLGERPQAERLA
jgi:hypothetical protein